jgi:hypothetical protein
MSTYKEQIFQFLKVAKSEKFDVFIDENDDINIVTTEKERFEQEAQGIQEGLMLAEYEFGGERERVELTITNGQKVIKLVKNPSGDDWETNFLSVL